MLTDLNFLFEFPLSRGGIISEIRNELDVIRFSFSMHQYDIPKTVIERVMVMPLRKLLFELDGKHDLLRKLNPSFSMPPLVNFATLPLVEETASPLTIWMPTFETEGVGTWIPLEEWISTEIASFDVPDDLEYYQLNESVFQLILNRLNGNTLSAFRQQFTCENVEYKGEYETVYTQTIRSSDETAQITSVLKNIGYYSINISRFIKHLSDKRGAHIDLGIAPMINVINGSVDGRPSAIYCLAYYLILAVKKQISELYDYWPEYFSRHT